MRQTAGYDAWCQRSPPTSKQSAKASWAALPRLSVWLPAQLPSTHAFCHHHAAPCRHAVVGVPSLCCRCAAVLPACRRHVVPSSYHRCAGASLLYVSSCRRHAVIMLSSCRVPLSCRRPAVVCRHHMPSYHCAVLPSHRHAVVGCAIIELAIGGAPPICR